MPDEPDQKQWRGLQELGHNVDVKVNKLQGKYLSDDKVPDIAARLARLRRGVSSAPGAVPEIWHDTLHVVPGRLAGRDTASAAEWAAHLSITLYALHQQGRQSQRMHNFGVSLGTAAMRLSHKTDRVDAIRARFQAVALAQTNAGLAYHLRSFVKLLRSEEIALDYGMLADDLHVLLDGRYADSVRLRWGRNFRGFRPPPGDSDISDDQAIDSTTEE